MFRILIVCSLFFLLVGNSSSSFSASKNAITSSNITDTTSIDYLLQCLENNEEPNSFWKMKLKNEISKLDIYFDSSRITLSKTWMINDSIDAVIFAFSTNVSSDECLFTFKNKHVQLSSIQISSSTDSDLSIERPYEYFDYELQKDSLLTLTDHTITLTEDQKETMRVASSHDFIIGNNGIIKPITTNYVHPN
jgi:hypothetical protein